MQWIVLHHGVNLLDLRPAVARHAQPYSVAGWPGARTHPNKQQHIINVYSLGVSFHFVCVMCVAVVMVVVAAAALAVVVVVVALVVVVAAQVVVLHVCVYIYIYIYIYLFIDS